MSFFLNICHKKSKIRSINRTSKHVLLWKVACWLLCQVRFRTRLTYCLLIAFTSFSEVECCYSRGAFVISRLETLRAIFILCSSRCLRFCQCYWTLNITKKRISYNKCPNRWIRIFLQCTLS